MKKELYKSAEFELISFDCDDVIVTSPPSSSESDPVDENQTELGW